MSDEKTEHQLPYPTTGRLEYVPGSRPRQKMSGAGGPHENMRESKRELLYSIMSRLFPDPDNQPDWFASHIPYAMIVASGYAPHKISSSASGLSGNFPHNFGRSEMCLFYNRYVVPRMEGKMSKRYLPRERLSKKELERLDFGIQTMIKLIDASGRNDLIMERNLAEFAALCNDEGARDVDGRQFTAPSVKSFYLRYVADAKGIAAEYDKYCTDDHQQAGLDKELFDLLRSGDYLPPQLPEKPTKGHDQAPTEAAKKAKESKPRPTATPPEQVIQPEAGPDQKLVEAAVAYVNEKANETVYKGSVEIGDYILDKFFDGDIQRAKSRKPTKRASYMALCRHKELAVHPATLGIMVRVAAQEKFFEKKKLPADKLSYSHKAELVKVEDDQEKAKLFNEAVAKSFSVRDLAVRVRQSKSAARASAGQMLLPGKQGVFNPERLLKNPVLGNEEKLREMKSEELDELLSQVTETLDRLAAYVAEYDKVRKRLETISQESANKPSS